MRVEIQSTQYLSIHPGRWLSEDNITNHSYCSQHQFVFFVTSPATSVGSPLSCLQSFSASGDIAAARVEADAGPHEGDWQDPRQQAGAPAGAQQVTRHGRCVDGAARHTGDGNTANHLGSGRHARLRAAVTPVGVAGVATGHRVRRRYEIRGRNRLVVHGLKNNHNLFLCYPLLAILDRIEPLLINMCILSISYRKMLVDLLLTHNNYSNWGACVNNVPSFQ